MIILVPVKPSYGNSGPGMQDVSAGPPDISAGD